MKINKMRRDITLKLIDCEGNVVEKDKIMPQGRRFYFLENMKILKILADRAEHEYNLNGNYSIVMEVR